MVLSLCKEKYERLMNGFKFMGYNPTLKFSQKKNIAEVYVEGLPFKFAIQEEEGQPDKIAQAIVQTDEGLDPETYQQCYQAAQKAVYYYQLQLNPHCPRCNASLVEKGVYQLVRRDYQFNRQEKSLVFSPTNDPVFIHYHCNTCHQPLDEAYSTLLTFEKAAK